MAIGHAFFRYYLNSFKYPLPMINGYQNHRYQIKWVKREGTYELPAMISKIKPKY